MLSIADKNQIHFINDLYPADYIYIAPKYGYIKVSSKIMLNLFKFKLMFI